MEMEREVAEGEERRSRLEVDCATLLDSIYRRAGPVGSGIVILYLPLRRRQWKTKQERNTPSSHLQTVVEGIIHPLPLLRQWKTIDRQVE
jgi:hypothetical protein